MLNKEHPYPECDEGLTMYLMRSQQLLTPDGYFPIFINWRSFLFSSYSEHLYSTRQGEQWSLPAGIASSPFVFLGDVGRAIGRAPMVWIYEINNALSSHRGTFFFKVKIPVYKHYSILKQRMYEEDKNQIHLSIGKDHGPPVTRLGNSEKLTEESKYYYGQMPDGSLLEGGAMTASFLLTLPTKFLSSPAIDSYGKPAWDIMNRRTELLRHQPKEYEDTVSGNRTGAVAKFLDKLVKRFPKSENRDVSKIEITLIGHSMGTIITNWMIADYGAQLNLKNIVYMAAASTISDFERQVVPYLKSKAGKQTEFYNLTLHPRQEVRERNVFDLSPRGSLLVWIDNYLSNPESFLDRTIGRWNNIIVASHVFPKEIRCRVHIKAFSVNEWSNNDFKNNPQNHGGFPNSTFWKKEFWEPVVDDSIEQVCN